jgi:hypothetical protein
MRMVWVRFEKLTKSNVLLLDVTDARGGTFPVASWAEDQRVSAVPMCASAQRPLGGDSPLLTKE